MYFPLSRSFLVYLSRFLSEHLMKRSHLGQLWGSRQQGSWATCSNPPCLYFSRSHCQVIVIGLTFQCNRCGNNFAPINDMENRFCRVQSVSGRSQSSTLLFKFAFFKVSHVQRICFLLKPNILNWVLNLISKVKHSKPKIFLN